MKKILFAIIITLIFTSCATIFSGSRAKVTFDSSTVKGPVNLTIDGQKHNNVSLPYQTKVKRGFSESIVKAEAPGYVPYRLVIDKSFNAVAVINLFDIVGWGIDAATGAMMKPEFKYYDLDMQKAE